MDVLSDVTFADLVPVLAGHDLAHAAGLPVIRGV